MPPGKNMYFVILRMAADGTITSFELIENSRIVPIMCEQSPLIPQFV